jgi:hypothetical protein
MGDSGMQNQVPQAQIARFIIEKGIGIEKLRDEVFAQLCMQTRNNSDP